MPLNTIPNTGLTSRGYPSDRLVTPIIINGDMSIAQRGTSTASITSGGYFTQDRFGIAYGSIGTWTQSQEIDVPSGQGFAKSLKMNCTTADASPATTDYLYLYQKIEGQNLQLLKKGTSNAESLTLSFWVKATKTGTNIIQLWDEDNDRSISKSYTVNLSNTWEKKTITFAGDTTGAFDNDNNVSLRLIIWLGAGSDFTSGTLATSWESKVNANRAVGQVNHGDSTSNNFYITGVQLEVGEFDSTTIPSFPFESFENNLRKCQRYYQIFTQYGNIVGKNNGTTTVAQVTPQLPVMLRASPTITSSSGFFTFSGSVAKSSSQTGPSAITFTTNKVGFFFTISGFSGLTDNQPASIRPESDMTIDAEL